MIQTMQRNPVLTQALEILLLSHSNITHALHTSLRTSSLQNMKSLYGLCVFSDSNKKRKHHMLVLVL